ncbi:MAG: helix-turn-helix domain-containing protein [Candidatus Aminicenantes bacterium]|nr:helix-turn-helix domain-containing protein [Candidatus Aminicenantes bacterium]
MREANYINIGLQLKNIRKQLNWTMDNISQATGISRSYLSDFERGVKLPTAKYLKYLHDTHHISLNFIFGSDGRLFNPLDEKNARPDFGKYSEEIDELLSFLSRVPFAIYAFLAFFAEYKINNRELIKQFLMDKEKEGTEGRKI